MAGNLKELGQAAVAVQATGHAALATGAAALLATANYDNSSTLGFTLLGELIGGFTVAPAAGTVIELYMVAAPDGANFGDVDLVTPFLPQTYFAGNFVVALSQTTTQRMLLYGYALHARLYRGYIRNLTGQQLAANYLVNLYGDAEQYT